MAGMRSRAVSHTEELNWVNILFLTLTPVASAVAITLHWLNFGLEWWQPLLFGVLYMAVCLSISLGYHRYFAHRAYTLHPAVEVVLLVLGAAAFENSVLYWAANHREHHRHDGTALDPHNIKRGGFWAHMGWIFFKDPDDRKFDNVPDLTGNPRVMWQHRNYLWLGIAVGFVLPTLAGLLIGGPSGALAGLAWGALLRVVALHHTTFSVNSIAHLWGKKPYSAEDSARDNFVVALVTNGEGYHNFHHKFPSDFRNGIRWWQYDPTKWTVNALHWLGLADGLNRTPGFRIELAKLQALRDRTAARLEQASDSARESALRHFNRAETALKRAGRLNASARAARRAYRAHLRVADRHRQLALAAC